MDLAARGVSEWFRRPGARHPNHYGEVRLNDGNLPDAVQLVIRPSDRLGVRIGWARCGFWAYEVVTEEVGYGFERRQCKRCQRAYGRENRSG